MPEPTTPSTPQAGGAGTDPQPQAGTTPTTPTPQAGAGKTPEDYERMLAELRKENAGHRTKLKKFEDEEAVRTQAQMSELEKAQKQAADSLEQQEALAAELFEARVFQDVARYADKFNFTVSSDTLMRFLLLDEDAIEFENGKPTNIEKLLGELAKKEPGLVKQSAVTPNAPLPTTPTLPAMNPGRSSIASPGQGTPGRIPGWNEIYKRP